MPPPQRTSLPPKHMQNTPTTCSPKHAFYVTLPILHGLGAIAAAFICFYCNVEKMNLQARVPDMLNITWSGVLDNNMRNKMFLAGYPWSEDADFVTHRWNPIVLIMLFQWLTAAFAVPNVDDLLPKGLASALCLAWLAAGYGVFLLWTIIEYNYFCVAMFLTGTVSYLATAWLCYHNMDEPALFPDAEQNYIPEEAGRLMAANVGGRKWVVPKSVKYLKKDGDRFSDIIYRATEQDRQQREQRNEQHEIFYQNRRSEEKQQEELQKKEMQKEMDLMTLEGVLFRYAEYCVTAPLLFLAVVCLLIPDAPAWLFLTGYWLVLACNIYGLALHYSFMQRIASDKPRPPQGMMTWLGNLLLIGMWTDPDSNIWYCMQGAWLAVLTPISGLVYMSRGWLFSSNVPALVMFMVWNLLVTFLMFGILPTFVYLTGKGRNYLTKMLDILNICAKFPLPIVIIVGFITRPVSLRPCTI